MIKALKKSVLVSILTLASRVLGLIRDALIAICFGVSIQSDAFFIAFRPFDLIRKLFSEGILNISFIPLFSKALINGGKERAASLLFSLFCLLSLAGIFMMLCGIIFAPFIIKIIAPGFAALSYQSQLTTILFKIMLPYFWLILISSICMGVLNSFNSFGVPAFAPVVFNLVVILFAIVVSNYLNTPVMALALGVTIGGVLQLALQIPFMIRTGILKASLFSKHYVVNLACRNTTPSEQKPTFFNSLMVCCVAVNQRCCMVVRKIFNPDVITILKVMIPSMIGAASYQINIMVASFFASKLDTGSVSSLYYADRLVQFPLALFAVSTAMVLLPQLSTKAAVGQMDEISHLFSTAVKLVFFVTIPAMAGLMALDEQIVSLLFGHGAFSKAATVQTSECLLLLSLGLWAFTGCRLFATLYYSLSNIKIPFYSGILAIGLNLIFCILSVNSFGLNGLVLSVSLASTAGFVILLINTPGSVKIDKFEIIVSACRSLFLSVIMFFFVQQTADLILLPDSNKFWFGTGVVGCIGLGIGFYCLEHYLISSPELKILKKGLTQKQI